MPTGPEQHGSDGSVQGDAAVDLEHIHGTLQRPGLVRLTTSCSFSPTTELNMCLKLVIFAPCPRFSRSAQNSAQAFLLTACMLPAWICEF